MLLRDVSVQMTAVAAVISIGLSGKAGADPGASLARTQEEGESRPVVRSARRDFATSERFITGSNETLELLLSDGTSILLADSSAIMLNGYDYDRETRSGTLDLSVSQGTVRVAGGALNDSRAIDIRTPFGDAALMSGVAIVEVGSENADLTLAAGDSLQIIGGGAEARATDGASRLRLARNGMSLEDAPVSDLRALVARLNPGLATGMRPVVVDEGQREDVVQGERVELDRLEASLIGRGTPQASPERPSGAGFGGVFEQVRAAGGEVTLGSTGTTSAQIWVWTLRRDVLGGTAIINDDGTISVSPVLSDDEKYPLRDPAITAGPGGNSTAWIYGNAANAFSQSLTDTSEPRWLPDMFFAAGTSDTLDANDDDEANLTQRFWLYDPSLDRPQFEQEKAVFTAEWGGQPYGITSGGTCGAEGAPCVEAAFTFDARFLATSPFEPESVVGGPEGKNLLGPCDDLDDCASFSALHAGFDGVSRDVTITGFDIPNIEGDDGTLVDNDLFVDEFAACFGIEPCQRGDSSAAVYAAIALNRAQRDELQAMFPFDDEVDGDGGDVSRTLQFTEVQLQRDHFLYIEGQAATGDDPDLFLYSTGFASGRGETPGQASSAPFRVDRFDVSAGLTGLLTRAFLAPAENVPLEYYDSGLWILNPATQNYLSTPSRMLHADFGLDDCGGGLQCSGISLSLGTLTYDADSGGAARGRALASTRGHTAVGGLQQERVLDTESAWTSSVAGGGNTSLDHSGRVGFLVLENYFPGNSAYSGGRERSIATSAGSETLYAATRLAVGEQIDASELIGRNAGIDISGGFLGGLVDRDDASNRGLRALASGADGIVLTADSAASSLSGTVRIEVDGGGTTTLGVGGEQLDSAYLDALRYGAFAGAEDAATAALVSAGLVLDGWQGTTEPPPVDQSRPQHAFREAVNGAGDAPYRHLQWGFFFGDFNTTQGNVTTAWHAHLVPWVGGQPTSGNAPLPAGKVTYDGHAVGNVLDGNASRSVVGTYSNTWNFANRTGMGTLDFDSALYPVRTELAAGSSARFSGFLLEPEATSAIADAASSFGPRSGSLAGSFMQGGNDSHGALAGSFTINRTRNDAPYQAAGVFGAERAPAQGRD